MPDTDLITGETTILCPQTTWTMILPSDWSREYFGFLFPQNPPGFLFSTNGNGDVTSRGSVAVQNQSLIVVEMWLERHRTLVCQEWWAFNTGFAAFNIVALTVRRLPKPVRREANGLLLPNRNGRTVDDLSGYDPAKMDTLLSEMKRQTRRFSRA